MGEAKKRPLRLHFDGRLRLEFHGARITRRMRDCWPAGSAQALIRCEASSVKLIKTGGRIVRRARHIMFQLAEVAVLTRISQTYSNFRHPESRFLM